MTSDVEYSLSLSQRMVSASVGAVLTSLIVTPLDVVKTRLQAQAEMACTVAKDPAQCPMCTHYNFSNGLMDHAMPKKIKCNHKLVRFNGTFDALVKIPRNEGIGSLYNGLPPTLLMAIPATVLYFASYDALKLRFDMYGMDWRAASVLAGSFARVTAATVVSPLELTRTKMQALKDPEGMARTMIRQVKLEGPTSLWRGLSPTLMRDVPFSAVYWVTVESGKRYLTENYMDLLKDKRIVSFLSGLFAGGVAAILTHPFDVIKTRKQVFAYSTVDLKSSNSTMDIVRRILAEEGPSGLYTGIVPRVSRVAPACAIMLSSYEAGKLFFATVAPQEQTFQSLQNI